MTGVEKENVVYGALRSDSYVFTTEDESEVSDRLLHAIFGGNSIKVLEDGGFGVDIFKQFLDYVDIISLNDCTVLQSAGMTVYLFPSFNVEWQAVFSVEGNKDLYRSVSVRDMSAMEFALEQRGVEHVRVEKPEEGLMDVSAENFGKAGVKDDSGKVKASLNRDFSAALNAVSTVGTFGANKYTRVGWQSVEGGIERYADAGQRHLDAWCMKSESDEDAESGLSHFVHYAWNVLAELELRIRADRMGYND